MDDSPEISDAEFLKWAGIHPQRWALLPSGRREGWLDHLVARIRATSDPQLRRAYWKLASVIASADARHPLEYEPTPGKEHADH
jgi:hypothetical protein